MDLRFVEMKKAMTVLCRPTAEFTMGLGDTLAEDADKEIQPHQGKYGTGCGHPNAVGVRALAKEAEMSGHMPAARRALR